jgi:hypothetical protein
MLCLFLCLRDIFHPTRSCQCMPAGSILITKKEAVIPSHRTLEMLTIRLAHLELRMKDQNRMRHGPVSMQ